MPRGHLGRHRGQRRRGELRSHGVERVAGGEKLQAARPHARRVELDADHAGGAAGPGGGG
jgi:hypothetical protein